jgi:ferredoxin
MRVMIDPDKCQGHGRCCLMVPEVFDMDEEGNGIIVQPEVPGTLEQDVRRAVSSCPERAITTSA